MASDLSFSHMPLEFCIVCEMALGVRNGAGCAKFFAWSAKISHGMQIDFAGVGLFSHSV